MTHRRWILILVVALLLMPALAHACPVCFDPRDKNRAAFFATTVFLSLLPLGLAGGLFVWLRRRARALGAADAAPQPLPTTLPSPR